MHMFDPHSLVGKVIGATFQSYYENCNRGWWVFFTQFNEIGRHQKSILELINEKGYTRNTCN